MLDASLQAMDAAGSVPVHSAPRPEADPADAAGTAAVERQAMRLLDVLEAVCRHGPAPLAVLVQRTGIPRGAVWRALDVLRDKGWVRMRHGDSAFELRPNAAGLFVQAACVRPDVELAMPVFERLAASGPVHVDLGMFTARGEFRIVETTRKDGYGHAPLSLTDDDIAVVAQLHLPPPELVRHLTMFMERAGNEERQLVSSGEHVRGIRRLRGAGLIWQDDGTAVSIALRGQPGVAIRAELWRVSKARIDALRQTVRSLSPTEGGV